MSYQSQRSPKQQLSHFASYFPRAAFGNLMALLVSALFFGPYLADAGVFAEITETIGATTYVPYFVASWMGLTIYNTSLNATESEEEVDEESDLSNEAEAEKEGLVQKFDEIMSDLFSTYATLTYLGITMTVAALSAAYVTIHIAPAFGILVAIGLPSIEGKLTGSPLWFLSPSTLLAFPAFIVLMPITLMTTAVLLILDLITTLSQTLRRVLEKVLKGLLSLFSLPKMDIPVFDPFRRTFNRR
ncbi:hypothetical protein [Halorubrum sp. Boch-26]|uniref:hypothetical protein n=1 Tax=Halorubrum sp. Boch-26 TaxID=2994426 RepID=UPI0024685341|nr:hypothetical protein [Halorubrum sp. Boch-26]